MTTSEHLETETPHLFGKGLYNEFGLETAIGFSDTKIGNWFHKIGVGLLKKEDEDYIFSRPYKVKPAHFEVVSKNQNLNIKCVSETVNGYAYTYIKTITLLESEFKIDYKLENTGEKDIITSEYNHNFIGIDSCKIDSDYILKLPFELHSQKFKAAVNQEKAVVINKHNITFNNRPSSPFFFSHLNGPEVVKAQWQLHHRKYNIAISETGSFNTKKVNLWGWSHVISPELFFDINLKPGKTITWSRTYEVDLGNIF